MISTCHGDSMSNVTTKRGDVLKPDALIDYNDAKKGIDISDQLASLHSALRKGLTWYKKKAVHILFQVAIINARCIYNEVANGPMLTVLQVQEQLMHWVHIKLKNEGLLARKAKQVHTECKRC
nr:uncharacterized protein LOC116765327 [Danaus plexippus plexippus]